MDDAERLPIVGDSGDDDQYRPYAINEETRRYSEDQQVHKYEMLKADITKIQQIEIIIKIEIFFLETVH